MPTAMPCIAIWDTGAMGTVITPKVVADLGLKPSEQITVQGVGPAGTSQSHPASTYLINLFLPNNVALAGIRVAESSVTGCDVLIGMDVIGSGDLAITNHNGKTTFTFRIPPCEEIDFVVEITDTIGGSVEESPLLPSRTSASSKINKKPYAGRTANPVSSAHSGPVQIVHARLSLPPLPRRHRLRISPRCVLRSPPFRVGPPTY
jgi:hypothetical protein